MSDDRRALRVSNIILAGPSHRSGRCVLRVRVARLVTAGSDRRRCPSHQDYHMGTDLPFGQQGTRAPPREAFGPIRDVLFG
jgi:hypothetical protein